MALWVPVLVPVYTGHWSIVDIAPLEVLTADGVEEQERGLTHTVAMVVKVAISSFHVVMILQIGSLDVPD